MKIAVMTESSTAARAPYIKAALDEVLKGQGHEILPVAMRGEDDPVVLNYMHVSFMSGMMLHCAAVDLVIGGCGTGQGFAIGCNQYPGVMCGVIASPLDAWLFRQINNGNAISLILNKEYGFGSDQKLKFILDAFFSVEGGRGYPEARREVQKDALKKLMAINAASHTKFTDFLPKLDMDMLRDCARNEVFRGLMEKASSHAAAELYLSLV